MKGIILAGGTGSRLHPCSMAVSKHLLPVYDKPLIYYPLSVMLLADVKEVLIICNSEFINSYKILLGDGKQLGLKISYEIQDKANGIAEALIIGEQFVNKDKILLILGDNIFYGQFFKDFIKKAKNNKNSTIFAYQVKDPENYGVVELEYSSDSFDLNSIKKNKIFSLKEKPLKPKSNYAITGMYFYENEAIKIAKTLKPSKRGEIEITDLNKILLKKNKLNVEIFGRGFCWLDAGTPDNLLDASMFIQAIEKRQGFKIACLEEIAFRNGYINREQLKKNILNIKKCEYRDYLAKILNE
jgi:glucose-1-phosphate thymidylyltransferase